MVSGSKGAACGEIGNPCKTIESYAECVPAKKGQKWNGLKRLLIREFKDREGKDKQDLSLIPPDAEMPKGTRDPIVEDDPLTLEVENEISNILNSEYFQNKGYRGICRSSYQGAKNPYKWYAYKGVMGEAGMFAMNKMRQSPNRNIMPAGFDEAGFELTFAERTALQNCKELKLTPGDVFCKEGLCPEPTGTRDVNGKELYTNGTYFFTDAPMRLKSRRLDTGFFMSGVQWLGEIFFEPEGTGIIDVLRDENVKMDGITMKRRLELADHLDDVYVVKTNGIERMKEMQLSGKFQMLLFLSVIVFQQRINTFLDKHLFKSVKMENLRTNIERDNKVKPDYRAKEALTREALAAWREIDNPRFSNMIVEGSTGAGKDVLVDEMLRLLVVKDPRLPPRILKKYGNAKLREISPADMQKNTKYRGSVADKVEEIFDLAEKGPLVLRAREIDKILNSGGTSEGDAEKVSGLFLSKLEKAAKRGHFVMLGTSSRTVNLMISARDLMRRTRLKTRHVDPLSLVIENLDGPFGKGVSERHYGVEIPRQALEAAGRLAEHIYRPTTIMVDAETGMKTIPLARYTAVENVLAGASALAEYSPDKTVTVEHVIAATEDLVHRPLDRTAVRDILKTPADDLMLFELPDDGSGGTELDPGVKRYVDPNVEEMLKVIKADPAIDTEGMFDEELREWARAMYEHLDADPAARARYVDAATGRFKQGAPAELFNEVGGAFDSDSMDLPPGIARSREIEKFEGIGSAREAANGRGKTGWRGWTDRMKGRVKARWAGK